MVGEIISTEDLPVSIDPLPIKDDQPMALELIGSYGLNAADKIKVDALAVVDDLIEWFGSDDLVEAKRRDSSGNIFVAVDKVVSENVIIGKDPVIVDVTPVIIEEPPVIVEVPVDIDPTRIGIGGMKP